MRFHLFSICLWDWRSRRRCTPRLSLSRDALLAPPEAHDPQSLSDGDIDAIVAWLTYKARTPP